MHVSLSLYCLGWNGEVQGLPLGSLRWKNGLIDPRIGGPALPYIVEGQVTRNETLIEEKTRIPLAGA